jgi:hypothetical protein
MNAQQLQSLSDQIFDIKEKCSDQEYKNLMDTLGKMYVAQTQVHIEDEDSEDDALDNEITRQAQINFERPLRGTKEWCLSSVATKAMWCGMTVETFIKDEQRKLHWADEAFYKKYPQYTPEYLKKKPVVVKVQPVKKETKQTKKESGCVIC